MVLYVKEWWRASRKKRVFTCSGFYLWSLIVDVVGHSTSSLSQATTLVWDSVSKWLPSRNEDCNFWWQKTGPHLASLLLQADYSVEEQYESLLFHYHLVVPHLGSRPKPSLYSDVAPAPIWKSFMTDDFSPIEYSWKWDTGKNLSIGRYLGPDIRYGIEAIGPYAGTVVDPRNQASTKAILHQLNLANPTIDLTWFHILTQALFKNELFTFRNEDVDMDNAGLGSSSMFLAFELLKHELAVKAYFVPPKPRQTNSAGIDSQERLVQAIRSLDALNTGQKEKSDWIALDQTLSFLDSSEDMRKLSVFMIGIDCVKPSESRLKIYVRSPQTSFDSIVNILTMGGKRTGFERNLHDLKDLWCLTLGLPTDFSTSEELPQRHHATSGICYYFDTQQGVALPDIKLYIPVRHYGISDLAIAQGLAKFLEMHERGIYAAGYLRALKALAPLHRLKTSCGVQTYISCAFQKDGLSMTSYLSPNIYQGV
jgi:DMATS type aromatic prenyltransferase